MKAHKISDQVINVGSERHGSGPHRKAGLLQAKKLICGHCQGYIPSDSHFCPHCGAKVARTQAWLQEQGNQRLLEYVVIVLLLTIGTIATLFLANRLR